jgi:hypothetical protein
VIEPQLRDVEMSGLFDRPKTYFHAAVSTNSSEELEWWHAFSETQRYDIDMVFTQRNLYEFPAIRWLWELACEHPDAIFLYFHNKGTRYATGRRRGEEVLTREIVTEWKDILSLLALVESGSHTIGVGGITWQWFNFFWIRGRFLFEHLPKPVSVADRWYYEDYSGSYSQQSQCGSATGIKNALLEPVSPVPKRDHYLAGYSLARCASARLSPQDANIYLESLRYP